MRSIPKNQTTYQPQNKNFDPGNLEHVHINPAILENEKDALDETLSDWVKTFEFDLKTYLQYKYVHQANQLQNIFNQQKLNELTALLFSSQSSLASIVQENNFINSLLENSPESKQALLLTVNLLEKIKLLHKNKFLNSFADFISYTDNLIEKNFNEQNPVWELAKISNDLQNSKSSKHLAMILQYHAFHLSQKTDIPTILETFNPTLNKATQEEISPYQLVTHYYRSQQQDFLSKINRYKKSNPRAISSDFFVWLKNFKKDLKLYVQNKYVENHNPNLKLFGSKKTKFSKFERTLLSENSSFDQMTEYEKELEALMKNSPNTYKAILIVVALLKVIENLYENNLTENSADKKELQTQLQNLIKLCHALAKEGNSNKFLPLLNDATLSFAHCLETSISLESDSEKTENLRKEMMENIDKYRQKHAESISTNIIAHTPPFP